MKKIVCLLVLSLCLCVGMAVPALAAGTVASGTCGDNLTWTLDDEGVLTICGMGPMEDFSSWQSTPWNYKRLEIKSVVIEDGVTGIGDWAFATKNCSVDILTSDYEDSLTSVTIPDSVTSIGEHAFCGCNNLTILVIPSNVKSIGYEALWYCKKLTNVNIPDGITEIGYGMFQGCQDLTYVTIPDSVTSIGSWAFDGCHSLADVTIPDSVVSIGDHAFSDCWNFTHMIVPNSVTSIGDGLFYNCRNLNSVIIGKGVTSGGGRGIFHGCVCLTNVTFHSNDIDFDSMENPQLTTVTIGDNATSIHAYMFYGFKNLTSVTIGNSVANIGDNAFSGCSGLTSITIPDSVTSIGYGAFENSGLTSVTIPDSVTSIGKWAFERCSSLTTVTIGDNVTSIGKQAFAYCSSLTSVTILPGVTSIGWSGFFGCSGLTSITIPSSVTSIGGWAFSGCSSLTDVYYGGTEAQWNAVTIESSNEPLKNARIHYNSSGSETIPAYAFPSAPTISGGASITRANVGTLTEIIVPVAYSGDSAQTVTFAVPFYDGSGKFIGVGMKTETVTSSTQSVTVPVSGLSGSESMKVMILGDDFDPLSSVGAYAIPA